MSKSKKRRTSRVTTVTISLPAELALAVDARVAALGTVSRSNYVCQVLRQDVARRGNLVIRPSNFSDKSGGG